jgi:hypothetical protein
MQDTDRQQPRLKLHEWPAELREGIKILIEAFTPALPSMYRQESGTPVEIPEREK